MKAEIFVDTNGWVALYSKRDQLHHQAIALNKHLMAQQYRYITTNFVLDETYTMLLMKVSHVAAVAFGEMIRHTQRANIIPIIATIEAEAWTLFKQYDDKQFSFTDCTSFVVMRQLALAKAFTNDHHFKQIGFEILL